MSDIEHTHTHQIDSYFQHARESVSLAIDGETNVLILFIAVIVLLLSVNQGYYTSKVTPRAGRARQSRSKGPHHQNGSAEPALN